LDWFVDSRLGGDGGRSWSASHETFRMELIGGIEYLLALLENSVRLVVVDHLRRE
jgi:hypothetical protein